MRGFRYFCKGYVVILVVATLVNTVIVFTTSYGNRTGMGCNFYDALLVGIDCRGFPGSGFVQFVLSFPLLLAYVSAFVFWSPWMLLFATLLWLPVLYILRSTLKTKNAQTHSS